MGALLEHCPRLNGDGGDLAGVPIAGPWAVAGPSVLRDILIKRQAVDGALHRIRVVRAAVDADRGGGPLVVEGSAGPGVGCLRLGADHAPFLGPRVPRARPGAYLVAVDGRCLDGTPYSRTTLEAAAMVFRGVAICPRDARRGSSSFGIARILLATRAEEV